VLLVEIGIELDAVDLEHKRRMGRRLHWVTVLSRVRNHNDVSCKGSAESHGISIVILIRPHGRKALHDRVVGSDGTFACAIKR
jgi:hypothetical protein